jgi:hypothetical protein
MEDLTHRMDVEIVKSAETEVGEERRKDGIQNKPPL